MACCRALRPKKQHLKQSSQPDVCGTWWWTKQQQRQSVRVLPLGLGVESQQHQASRRKHEQLQAVGCTMLYRKEGALALALGKQGIGLVAL